MVKQRLVLVKTKNDPQLKKRKGRNNDRTIIQIIGSERSTSDLIKLQRAMFQGRHSEVTL